MAHRIEVKITYDGNMFAFENILKQTVHPPPSVDISQ